MEQRSLIHSTKLPKYMYASNTLCAVVIKPRRQQVYILQSHRNGGPDKAVETTSQGLPNRFLCIQLDGSRRG